MLACGSFVGCEGSGYDYTPTNRTYHVYDTDGPVVLSEVAIRSRERFLNGAVAVLVERCRDDRNPPGGGDVPCWPNHRFISQPTLAKLIPTLPRYRDKTAMYHGTGTLNCELGLGATLIIGVRPIALAFVDIDEFEFFNMTREHFHISNPDPGLRRDFWVDRRTVRLATPDDSDLKVFQLVVYPPELAPTVDAGMIDKRHHVQYVGQVYHFEPALAAKDLLPIVGNAEELKKRAIRIESVIAKTDCPTPAYRLNKETGEYEQVKPYAPVMTSPSTSGPAPKSRGNTD